MTAIIASTVGVKTMADDTLRLTIDIDPRYAGEAFALFGRRGSSCAIARLTSEAAVNEMRSDTAPEENPKGGPLAKLAGMFCNDNRFWIWALTERFADIHNDDDAAQFIRNTCGISSRAELDHNPVAAEIFHREIRIPYSEKRRLAA